MKTTTVTALLLGGLLMAPVSSLRAQETRFFRIVGPVPTAITDVTAEGTVTWTNVATNATFTVQAATALPGGWTDYVQVPTSNAPVTVHRIFDPNPPPGMAFIPAGCFTMGDTFSEGVANERPVHAVFVSAFLIEQHDVTKEVWDVVYHWAVTNGYAFDNVGTGKAADHLVHTVNWFDAVRWCNARSEMEGLTPVYYLDTGFTVVYRESVQAALWTNFVKWNADGYRLPTEAEWEKAARGGWSGRRFLWGDTLTHIQANYYSSAAYAYDVSETRAYHTNYNTGGFPYTNPVEDFAPNDYGLHGMADNVSEWCWDWFDVDWYGKPGATVNDPRGPRGDGMTYRVRRGGAWNIQANKVRAAFRDYGAPANATSAFGFRCVRGL